MAKSVLYNWSQVAEPDGSERDEAEVQGCTKAPVLPAGEEDWAHEEVADDDQHADHDGNADLEFLLIFCAPLPSRN